MKRELIIYRDLLLDEVFSAVTALIDNAGTEGAQQSVNAGSICGCVRKMAAAAEKYGVAGNLWNTWIAVLIAESENTFSLAHERREIPSGTLRDLAARDFEQIYYYLNAINSAAEALPQYAPLLAENYEPLNVDALQVSCDAGKAVSELAEAVSSAKSSEELLNAASDYYRKRGVGRFGLYGGFRWDAYTREIVPALPLEDIRLNDLIGYEDQKNTVIRNTIAFLDGRPANNVLLYGEGGTGKSSTIKALLNEYAPRGLRMIEIYKHQMNDLETILESVKNRNYKFILFMDDLSFEQFEVEYKFLKAFIEGGLEKRPDNVLIYATSNRRHLMKETWGDRADKDDDMHESETMQEKMSLVDRFGLMIRYFSPEQAEYLRIVHSLADAYGVNTDPEELELGAIRWELKHGGFSGRSARQYVEFLAGEKEEAK